MLKQFITDITEKAVKSAIKNNNLGQMTPDDKFTLNAETPKNEEFGDFAVNVSSFARFAKLPPAVIAQNIAQEIKENDVEVNTVAGFINFKLGKSFLNATIAEILNEKQEFGSNDSGHGEKVLLEYVSANPTGPFHIGHGRWAAMGSALANLLKFAGYDVSQEFYINDAGNQIKNLGKSLHIRVLQELGEKIDFPADEIERKSYYPGDYLIPLAKSFVKDEPEFAKSLTKELSDEQLKVLSDYARLNMLELQKELLKKFNTHFDTFYSELDLHKSGKVEDCVKKWQEKGRKAE